MTTEQDRALLYRQQQQAREDHKLAEERRLAGSEAARRQAELDTLALMPWSGWEPVRKVKGDEE